MKKYIFFLLLVLGGVTHTYAHDFEHVTSAGRLYLNVLKNDSTAVSLTYAKGRILYSDNETAKKNATLHGRLVIPSRINHGGRSYIIRSIGDKAFYNEYELKEVVIPSTVREIGDFAFEGCTSLTSVVFPAAEPRIGSGAFFRCERLQNLSFGSDWHRLDLSPYRWSRSLTDIGIPSHVVQVVNLKSLPALRALTVDPNNRRFSAYKGALYNRDGKVLYGVPCAYSGALTVAEGTDSILPSAFSRCLGLESLDLPASIRYVSFRDLGALSALKTLAFRGNVPPVTAYAGDRGVFLLESPNAALPVTVMREAKAAFTDRLVSEAGEYREMPEPNAAPYTVTTTSLVKKKQIKTVKSFPDYE